MEKPNKSNDDYENKYDLAYFDNIKANIERELENLRRTTNYIVQMRVDMAYILSDLLLAMDADSWENIADLIDQTPMKMDDINDKSTP